MSTHTSGSRRPETSGLDWQAGTAGGEAAATEEAAARKAVLAAASSRLGDRVRKLHLRRIGGGRIKRVLRRLRVLNEPDPMPSDVEYLLRRYLRERLDHQRPVSHAAVSPERDHGRPGFALPDDQTQVVGPPIKEEE